MGDELAEYLAVVVSGLRWLRENSNISGALGAEHGVIGFRQTVINQLHDVREAIESALNVFARLHASNELDAQHLEDHALQSLNMYESKLLDSRVNPARAFHISTAQLEEALQYGYEFVHYLAKIHRDEPAPETPDLIEHPESSTLVTASQTSNESSLINAPSSNDKSPLESPFPFLQTRSTLAPGIIARAIQGAPSESDVPEEKLEPQTVIQATFKDNQRDPQTEQPSRDPLGENSPKESGGKVLTEIRMIRRQLQEVIRERDSLRRSLLEISGGLLEQNLADTSRELEILRLSSHIDTLEEEKRVITQQILQLQDTLDKRQNDQKSDSHQLIKENIRLINQLYQERKQRVDNRYHDLRLRIDKLYERIMAQNPD